MPLHGRKVNFYVGRQLGAHHVAGFFGLLHVGTGDDAEQVFLALDNAFGKQKAGGQLLVVARRAHRD
jgi:hypothetical protein